MNTELEEKPKMILENIFSGWWTMQFLEKLQNVRNRDIKLLTTEARKNYLLAEPNYHATNFSSENLLTVEMKKAVYLGLWIWEISKIVMCEFWFDYLKLKYGEKPKLYYIDTDSFIVYIKTEDIYLHIA